MFFLLLPQAQANSGTVKSISLVTGIVSAGETASQQELPGGQDYVIVDSSGKVWSIDESGHVTEGGEVAPGGASTASNTEGVSGSGSNAAVTQYAQGGVTITWDASNSIYAFDTPQATGLPGKNYQTLKDSNGNTVDVPYKAVVNGQTDEIKAILTFTDNSLKDRQLVFKTLSSGREIPATKNSDTEYTLQLKGMMDYAEEDVVAVFLDSVQSQQNQKVTGSFKLVHLSPKTIKVTLVPTDAASKSKLAAIKEKTNAIFAKAGITIDFNEDAIFDITPYLNGSDKIETADNTLLSTYSAVQQAINAAYGDKNGDRYVLFVSSLPSSTGQMGYMRLNGRFGYVFGSATDKTAAHELGHGIFKLEHPWEKYGTDRNKTQLLMDYSDGAQISHLDWKQVNDPALKFYLFQGQSEGEINKYQTKQLCVNSNIDKALRKNGYVLGANDQYFKLNDNAVIRRIAYTDNSKNPANQGAVTVFEEGGKTYIASYNPDTETFISYKEAGVDNSDRKDIQFETSIFGGYYKIEVSKANCTVNIDEKTYQLSEADCNCATVSYSDLNVTGLNIYNANKAWIPDNDYDILLNIASLAQNLSIDLYNSFIFKQENDGSLFWNYKNRPTEYSREKLQNTLEQFKKYQVALEQLNKGSFANCDELVSHVVNNFQITKGSNNPFVFPSDMTMTQIITEPFKELSLERKKQLIDILHKCEYDKIQLVGDDVDAGTVLATLFKTSNEKSNNADSDTKALLDYIAEKKYLKHFVEDLYSVQYEGFMNALLNMILKNYKYDDFKIGNPESNPNYLKFSPAFLQLNSEHILDNGTIQLEVKRWFGNNKYTITDKPYAPVAVEFVKDVDFGANLKFKAGEGKVLPMIWAYQLFWDDTKAARWKSAQIIVDVALTAVGVGEVTAAVRLYRAGQTARATFLAVKALGDVGVGFTDIYIQNDDVLTDEQLAKWNKFVLVYSVGSLSTSAVDGLVQKLGKKAINSSDDFAKIEQEIERETEAGYKKLSQSEKNEIDGLINYAGDVFDFNKLKNLVAKTPGIDNGSLTNLPKSFWNDAYKYKPTTGAQKTLLDDILANGDNAIDGAASGSKTETLVEDIFKNQDYHIANGKYAGESGNNGFDIVAYKGTLDNPTEIVIVECKQMNSGAVKLNAGNPNTGLPTQMSDGWIEYVRLKLKDAGKTDVSNMLLYNKDKITKYVSSVDKTEGCISNCRKNELPLSSSNHSIL
ncbi:hypothetical protein FACS189413_05920 [Bacteroidia bacterium]|nr:hypothetical protein FACS189413_05920 [Bacteroidia bacterium]